MTYNSNSFVRLVIAVQNVENYKDYKNNSHVRGDFIEVNAPVPFHMLLGVDLQLFIGIHWHQHRANVRLVRKEKEWWACLQLKHNLVRIKTEGILT